jgi:ribonuclease T1
MRAPGVTVRRLASMGLLGVMALLLVGCSLMPGGSSTARSGTLATPMVTATDGVDVPAGWGGGTVDVADLTAEAIDTLLLIAADGPYPLDQDGATFQNREAILPDEPRGYYREYTVVTPGSRDRGARRIVTGRDGERYYTDDHYDSFRFVVGEPAS